MRGLETSKIHLANQVWVHIQIKERQSALKEMSQLHDKMFQTNYKRNNHNDKQGIFDLPYGDEKSSRHNIVQVEVHSENG